VYKKYLGEDYDFNQQDYSIMISNHIGFYEIIYNMVYNYTGFIAKKDVANYYFVGVLAKGINCLFVDRESEESRKKIFDELEERQKLYYKKELLTPLCLFPEGTTTTGNHILKFKKGAFFALLPIKPQILDIYHEDEFHLAIGVAPVVSNWLRSGNYSRHRIYHIDLPVIKPTKFMFEKYKDLGNEKWEIFSEVTRKIMCEVSGLKPSNKNYRDMKKYLNSIINGKYEEDIDIKQD
jgi:lysophosphatidylcholine acyltransferase/lyso-PAF acetyltransferase